MKIVLGITGASGSIYAKYFIQAIKDTEAIVHIVPSKTGASVLEYELNVDSIRDIIPIDSIAKYKLENYDDFFASIASGSYKVDKTIILPASMSTVASIAAGVCNNLIHRAASIALKEKRSLVIGFRESPLTAIDLSNLLHLAEAGAVIMPLAPGFYHKPTDIDDIVKFMVGKILDSLNIDNDLFMRWS